MGERRASAETEKRDKGNDKMTERERKRGNIRGRMCVCTRTHALSITLSITLSIK